MAWSQACDSSGLLYIKRNRFWQVGQHSWGGLAADTLDAAVSPKAGGQFPVFI